MSNRRPTILVSALLLCYGSSLAQQSITTYPQIVRLSFVQGDVRIDRGSRNEKVTHAAWEQAVTGLPLQSGFSLVTGPGGRAEIEFEDASTMYLAENSALVLNDLATTEGRPSTTLTLLSGSLSTNIHTTLPGEQYLILTPTGQLALSWPDSATERIDSYLDSMATTSLSPLPQSNALSSEVSLRAVVYQTNQGPENANANYTQAFAEWDHWVAARVAERSTRMTSVMQQAGLTQPLPGLDEMASQGTFFDCPPYGKCWEPTNGWTGSSPNAQTTRPIGSQSSAVRSRPAQSTAANSLSPPVADWQEGFPCAPEPLSPFAVGDRLTQESRFLDVLDPSHRSRWILCHVGTWIRHRDHYVWVVGSHRHHRPPVRWVKVNGHTGFVPLHPNDHAGKQPVNLAHGVYVPGRNGNHAVQVVAIGPVKKFELLAQPPKDFRQPALPVLARANAPTLQARNFAPYVPGDTTPIRTSALTFDHKSQTFQLAGKEMRNGHTVSIVQPFGPRTDRTRITHDPVSRTTSTTSFGASTGTHAGFGGQTPRGNSGNIGSGNPRSTNGGGGAGSRTSGGFSGGGGNGGSFHGGGASGGSRSSGPPPSGGAPSGGSHK